MMKIKDILTDFPFTGNGSCILLSVLRLIGKRISGYIKKRKPVGLSKRVLGDPVERYLPLPSKRSSGNLCECGGGNWRTNGPLHIRESIFLAVGRALLHDIQAGKR